MNQSVVSGNSSDFIKNRSSVLECKIFVSRGVWRTRQLNHLLGSLGKGFEKMKG